MLKNKKEMSNGSRKINQEKTNSNFMCSMRFT